MIRRKQSENYSNSSLSFSTSPFFAVGTDSAGRLVCSFGGSSEVLEGVSDECAVCRWHSWWRAGLWKHQTSVAVTVWVHQGLVHTASSSVPLLVASLPPHQIPGTEWVDTLLATGDCGPCTGIHWCLLFLPLLSLYICSCSQCPMLFLYKKANHILQVRTQLKNFQDCLNTAEN